MCKAELTVKGLPISSGLVVKCSGKVGKMGAVSSLAWQMLFAVGLF